MTARIKLPQSPRVLSGCEKPGYEALEEELAYWLAPEKIRGAIPPGLNGTLFRSCVGRNKIGNQQFGHYFDGDGMINAVTFKNGRVHYRNRYVRTPKYIDETAAQRILYRGVGTQIPGGMLKNMFRSPGNAANTNVILHGGKLLALWEGGKPWELDPATLETVGEYTYHGGLKSMQPFSAHSRFEPNSGFLYNFGVFGVPKPKLHLYAIDPTGKLVSNRSHYVGDYSMCHDFVITEQHAIFVLCPAFMRSPFKFLFGRSSILESIEFDPSEKTRVAVLNLESGEVVRTFEFDSFFGFHHGNGFETGDELTFHTLCVDNMDVMGGLADVFQDRGDDFDFLANGASLTRFKLNLVTGETHRETLAGAIAGEFPLWNPRYTGRENRYTWMGTMVENGTPYDFNAYQKLDHQSGELRLHDFGPGRFTSEANFIPASDASGEDDGYLISIVYNHERGKSEIVILDAQNMVEEVAVIELDHHVPFGFHGNFYPQVFI